MTVTFTVAKRTGSVDRVARAGRRVAGPALIVAAVVVALHGFLFQSRLSSQHPDILGFWLPTYCFLGKSLAAGHIPAWNPHVMAGVPFAADPQSGWMYAPAMLLFSTLPCGVAMRAMIALQPVLGGLGLYGFLRREGLSSPAATTGGLALALGLCASRLLLFLPFPSAFAWTAVLLWCCSGAFHARTRAGRVGWALAASVAWGQLAAAYFSHGLILGTAAVVFYFVAKALAGARAGTHPGRGSLALLGLLVLAFVGVNLAFLLPRLAYIPETSYGRIVAGPVQVGSPPDPSWPLKLATSPGGYLGMAALVLAGAASWSRRHRPLVIAFGAYGAASYLLGVDGIAPALARAVKGVPVLDFYAHFPGRFSLGLFLALPVLAAAGLDAWLEPRRGRERALMLVPGVAVFVLLPAALGAGWHRLLIPAFGLIAGGIALAVAARLPRVVTVIPGVLAAELVAGALLGQTSGTFGATRVFADDLFGTRTTNWFVPLARPDVHVDAYLRPGPIARALARSEDRYVSLDPSEATTRGYLTLQDPSYWGLMANSRAMLFGLQDAQGYNPVQLDRYWTYVRAVTRRPLAYNSSIFDQPSSATRDLLQVGEVVVREQQGTVPCCLRAREARWLLLGSSTVPLRASVLDSWQVLAGKDASLRAVAADGFDPTLTVILETDPAPLFRGALDRGEGVGGSAQRNPGPQIERLHVRASAPSVVLVRIPYARSWHATVDGEPGHILPANHVLMGIPVRRGSHTIVLSYDDPWIGYGLLGSLIFVVALLVAWLLVRRANAARLRLDRTERVSEARSG
jgi:MYXO-CTERM domain-containing protein